MKTWRERNQDARERGEYTTADWSAWMNPQTCLVGEVVSRYFGAIDEDRAAFFANWNEVNRVKKKGIRNFQDGITSALADGDVDFMDKRLDAIEDHALELKRSRA